MTSFSLINENIGKRLNLMQLDFYEEFSFFERVNESKI
jgi:hypothetical protein